jgi:hypothetical protein
MTAYGRKQPFDSLYLWLFERPLLMKADIQDLNWKNRLANVRYTLQSRHWAKLALKGRL